MPEKGCRRVHERGKPGSHIIIDRAPSAARMKFMVQRLETVAVDMRVDFRR